MNWSKAKDILIVLFLLTGLFLLFMLIKSTNSPAVSSEVIESTITVLNNNGISIDKSVIPQKYASLPYKEADNVISSYDDFAKKLLGESYVKGENNTYLTDVGVLEFSNNYFSYKYTGAVIDVLLDKNIAQKKLDGFLQSLGFQTEDTKFTVSKNEAVYNITCENYSDNVLVRNSLVMAEIMGDTVTSLRGTWFNLTDAKGDENEIKAVSTSLIDLILLSVKTPATITKIDLVYDLPIENSYHKSAVLVPSWFITTEDGMSYCIDARNPE